MTDSVPSVPTRPHPRVDDESAELWAGSLRGVLVLQRCLSCGYTQYYPRWCCVQCHGSELQPTESTGRGAIYSRTVIRQNGAPPFRDLLPYVVALIDLDDGPRMLSNVVGCEPEQAVIGARVRVVFEPLTEEAALFQFVLDDGGA